MSSHRISIIIPAYNEEGNLDRLLSYIRKHSGDLIKEVIVADGGSTDGTIRVAEKHGITVKICTQKGRAAQMNEGAEDAAGSVLYFLHADTFPPKNFDKYISKTLQQGYRCGSFRLLFDDPHPLLRFYAWFTRFPLTVFRFGDQSLFVTREIFQSIGGFDESLAVMEDQKIVRELKKKSPFKVMNASVTTSARRYRKNGVIRLQAVFTLIVLMYYLGARQSTLVHVYQLFTWTKDHAENSE